MADEFLRASAIKDATDLYTSMSTRTSALLDTAEISIPAALAAVERRAQTVSGLQGQPVDYLDADGVRITGLHLGTGDTIVLSSATYIDPDGVLITGYQLGGVV